MICGYKYRIYPNNNQTVLIHKTFGCVRKMWNSLLAQSLDKDNKHYLPKSKRTKKQYSIKELKQEYGYMYEVDSHALANTWRNLKQAWNNHFRKNSPSGTPHFKKKRHAQSYQTNNLIHNCHGLGSVRIVDKNHIIIPKLGHVKIRSHRSFQGTIKTVTVRETTSGEFYATLMVDDQPDKLQLAKTKQAVGIDLNIKNGETIVTSDGEVISKPDTIKLELRLHKQQKKLARRLIMSRKLKKNVWESMNYQKQRRKVAKTRAKIAKIRKDWLHKVTWSLVNSYDEIHIEDLNVSGMVRNHRLAKHIADSLFGEFRRQLTYKCEWYGKHLVLVDRWYPSSQLCSNCGYRNHNTKNLAIRKWICPQCGKHHSRDFNAAINILNYTTSGTDVNA